MTRFCALTVPHRFGAIDAQLNTIDQMLAGVNADLVVLPETSLTGYVSENGDYDLRPFAEPVGGSQERTWQALAKRHNVALLAPLIESDAGNFYNACVWVDRTGVPVTRYRKRHPWFPETWAAASDNPLPLVEFGGVRVSLCICFDIHFVEKEAPDTLAAADVLLFPSEWTEVEDSRPALLSQLAQKFDLTIVNANWGKGRPRMPGQGHSLVVTKRGVETSTGPAIFAEL